MPHPLSSPAPKPASHLPGGEAPSTTGTRRGRSRTLFGALCLLPALLVWGCSDGGTGPSNGDVAGPEVDLGAIPQADGVTFDVEWEPGTVVAEESWILSDVHDLMVQDGVYRVDADSPLLDGLSVGDIVVWPQLGIFNILSVNDRGSYVEVATDWARFSDAVAEADIQFDHVLRAGPSGRAVGVSPAGPSPAMIDDDVAFGVMASSGPIRITEDGVSFSHDGGGYDISLSATSGGEINVGVSAGGSGFTSSLTGQVRGLQARGAIQLDPNAEDDDPAIGLFFDDVTLDVESELSLSDAGGDLTITPNAALVFPFSIGPIPAFVAIGTRLQIRSSISRVDTELSATAGFSAVGDVAVGRNPDGNFAAQGEVKSFTVNGPEYAFQVSNTSGMGLDFDAPRITFGLGRPGLSPVAIYGTQSAEFTVNVVFNTDAEYCATASTGGAVTVGGELNVFFWSAGTQRVIATRSGPSRSDGPGCSSSGTSFAEHVGIVEPAFRLTPEM